MREVEINKLAKGIVNYSCRVKKGEKVLIETVSTGSDLINALIKEIYSVGAYPFVHMQDEMVNREIMRGTDAEHSALMANYMKPCMSDMDAYIGIRGGKNIYELSDINHEKLDAYNINYSKPIHHDIRVNKKWVILEYPTASMAERTGMSTEKFEEFYFNVCNLDYKKMTKALKVLKQIMEKTDKVRIVAPETDLTFSIKNINAIICTGECNIPDGEIYTAPVANSINGTILFNIPSVHSGLKFEKIKLTFSSGKIVNAEANYTKELNKILDTDEGARFVGEFAFGVNPYINSPTYDILFDEKMMGSIHMAMGACYKDAYNGNVSAIHWDLIQSHTLNNGGGKIYLDGVLVRENGIFVLEELKPLNPENLK